MDETDLVSYYQNKAKEWIVTPTFKNVLIEDDEILDLDSISLDSNEDTWLYSSNNKSFADSLSDNCEKMLRTEELSKRSNIEREIESSDYDTAKSTYADNSTSVFSPDSPLLCVDDFQHNSFLNSIDAMSDSALDDLLKTPSHAKSKSNFLKKALSSSTSRCGADDSNTFIKPKTDCDSLRNEDTRTPTDYNTYTFKKPFSESVEKSYILHSVENKLFTINNVDGNDLKSVQTKEIKKVSDIWKGSGDADIHDNDPTEEKKYSSTLKSTRVTPIKPFSQRLSQIETDASRLAELKAFENDENTFKKQIPLSHSTPCHSENMNRTATVKKPIALCQPSPVLLNRYLKYNKIEEKNNCCLPKRRTSNEYAKEEMNDKCDKPDRNEMNVSYIKYSNDDNVDLPNINADESPVKSTLNGTYSKSDDVLNSSSNVAGDDRLNSTYDLIEDDVKSSTSESSLSSMSNKHPLSIKEVEKMAELQELSLKKHIHSSYYAGSSKSSEVSSSNESISGFGQLSSSNEGQINVNTLRNTNSGGRSLRNQSLMYSRGANSATSNSRSAGNYNRSGLRLELQPTATSNTAVKEQYMPAKNVPKLSNMFKNKLSLHNGATNVRQSSNKKESNTKTIVVPKCSLDSSVNEEGDFISVKEIKSRDNTEVKSSSNIKSGIAGGPGSHIPRPSSRIPMLRTSTSCTRYSQSK